MKSYVIEHLPIGNNAHIITKYSHADFFLWSVFKFLAMLFIVWPIEIFIVIPLRVIGILLLALCEMILKITFRSIWWVIKLPFCLLFKHRLPKFWPDEDDDYE